MAETINWASFTNQAVYGNPPTPGMGNIFRNVNIPHPNFSTDIPKVIFTELRNRKTEIVVTGVGGFLLRGGSRFAVAGLGISGVGGTMLAGAAAGGLIAATKEYFGQVEELTPGVPVTSIQDRVARRMVAFREVNRDQAKRIGMAFLKGAAVGAVSAVVGAELRGLFSGVGEIHTPLDGLGETRTNFKNWVDDKMSGFGSNVRYFPLVDAAISLREHPDLMVRRAPGIGWVMDRFQGEFHPMIQVPEQTIPEPTPIPVPEPIYEHGPFQFGADPDKVFVVTDVDHASEVVNAGKVPVAEAVSSLKGKGAWQVANRILFDKYHFDTTHLDYFSDQKVLFVNPTTGIREMLLPAEIFNQYVETDKDYQGLLDEWMKTTLNNNDHSMFNGPTDTNDYLMFHNNLGNASQFELPDAKKVFDGYYTHLNTATSATPSFDYHYSPEVTQPTIEYSATGGFYDNVSGKYFDSYEEYLKYLESINPKLKAA